MKQATKKDMPLILKILTPAFCENKSVNRCVKQDTKRPFRIEKQIWYVSRICLKNKMAYINENKNGVILCNMSNGKKSTILDDIYYLFNISGLKLGLQLIKREKLLKQILPKKVFCHLWFIGIDTSFQSKGDGSKMIENLKKICIEKKLPIYLETSNSRNIMFYEKNGFKLYHKCQLPTDDFELFFFYWNP